MAADGIERADVLNVLRLGVILEEGEEVHGTWRYRLHLAPLVVVVALEESLKAVRVVTAWKVRRGRR